MTWGDQTWEEMAVAFFEVARPHGQNDEIDEPVVLDPVADRKRSAEINQFVKSFFSRFDSNKDGTILPEEMPLAQKRFGFGKFDENHDQQLTESEVRRVAMREKR